MDIYEKRSHPMKKLFSLIIPVFVILVGTMIVPKMVAGSVNSSTLVLISISMIALLFLFRPKKGAAKSAQQVLEEIIDDYCQDAFNGSEELEKKFLAAVNDIGNNLPKSSLSKLQKLAPQCSSDPQRYAVAKASALVCRLTQDWKGAIREYNRAIVLNPTEELAYNIGECNQRIGKLDKARDSYEFAMELNPNNVRYPSSLATAYVGDGDYDTALDYARDALTIDENYPQALATMAICYGMKNDSVMYRHYTIKAAEAGYNQDKIETTVKELKKRER